jgi:hypothetical protein
VSVLHERAFEFLARAGALQANSRFLAAKAVRMTRDFGDGSSQLTLRTNS